MKVRTVILFLLFLLLSPRWLQAQGTAFTYQGRLTDPVGNPVSGIVDLKFNLYAAQSGGSPLATVEYPTVSITNGLLNVNVDLGNQFDGSARWLEIQDVTHNVVFARQHITATPYAILAQNALNASNAITANSVISNGIAGASIQNAVITAAKIANGQVVKSINGLNDAVTISNGPNVTVTTNGNVLTIAAGSTLTNAASLNSANVFTGSNTFNGSNFFSNINMGFDTSEYIQVHDLQYLQFGTQSSPQAATIQMNTLHGGGGDGSELGIQFNQLALVARSWIQVGLIANQGVTTTMYMQRVGGYANAPSDLFSYCYQYTATNVQFLDFIHTQGVPSGTNGDAILNFYDPLGPYLLNIVPNSLPSHPRFQIHTRLGTLTRGVAINDLSQQFAGASYGVSWESAQYSHLNMLSDLTITNIPNSPNFDVRTNTVATRVLELWSGIQGWALYFPTNWIWESESGTATAPTNISGSNVMFVTVRQEMAADTNYIAHYTLAHYSPVLDTNAVQFLAAITNSGGSFSKTERVAINTLVLAMKADGSWYSNDVIYPFIGGTTNSMSWNLVNTNTFRLAFSGTVHASSQGIAGDGVTGFANTGYTPGVSGSQYKLHSASLAVYNNTSTSSGTLLGTGTTGVNYSRIVFVSPNSVSGRINENADQTLMGLTNVIGFYTISSVSGVVNFFYGPDSSLTAVSDTSTALPAQPIYLFAQNESGVANSFSGAIISYVSIGGGKDPALQGKEATDVLAFETYLGRR